MLNQSENLGILYKKQQQSLCLNISRIYNQKTSVVKDILDLSKIVGGIS